VPTATLKQGQQLTFDVFGKPGRIPVFLISGAGAPAEFWPQKFCDDLASAGFVVIRYSHRDTGYSSHFDSPYGIETLLCDLNELINSLGHERVHVVGHSMGGYLAQLAMCNFPDRLHTATSISAGSIVSDEMHKRLGTSLPAPEVWDFLIANQPIGDFDRDLPGWLGIWTLLNGDRYFDEAMAADYTRRLYEGDPRNAQVATNHIHAMGTVPDSLVERLPYSHVPLLVLHGTEDPLVPIDNGRATSHLAGVSTFCPLSNAGHMFFNQDSWDEIRARLIDHFSC
jgi:pimeloyl-ACP methyl ester carboxylesterase